MDNLIFSVNAVSPIVLTVLLGYLLKRIGWIPLSATAVMNRLVFRLFLPAMLFLNVYKINSIGDIELGYVAYALIFVCGIFLFTIPVVMLITKDGRQRGPLLQGTFRSNFALVGIPLASSLFPEKGGMVASVLSAFLVPLLNVLAVISLSVFRKENRERLHVGKILLGIVKNPLIISIALGAICLCVRPLLQRYGVDFRLSDVKPIYSTLTSLAAVATPLALVTLGAQFEFSAVAALKKPILWGVFARGLLIPAASLTLAYLMGCFRGEHFATFVAAFATPVAVSSVPMTQEMDSDVTLAGQLVVWTTVVSGFTIFFTTYVLKTIGVFG